MENGQTIGDEQVCEFLDGEVIDWDEIVSIEYVGMHDTIDINVTGDRLFWANDILTHNSAVESNGEFDHSHIAGGLSKINTADNVFAIYTTPGMKERGEYQLQMLKTRSSAAVGQRVELGFDSNSLLITDPDPDKDQTATRSSSTIANDIKSHANVSQNTAGSATTPLPAPIPVASASRTNMMDILNKVRNK